ncbi:MAG TPA: DUF1549 domain-containing protein, partial [Myxococcales bacterium]|nr:DUF1549 domain-containing protein [Myxococcales bacterium]
MKFLTVSTLAFLFVCTSVIAAAPVDRVLERENKQFGVTVEAQPLVDDLTYLRRVSIDLIGRIPTSGEIDEYLSWPASIRRQDVVEKLINDEHFADRWTVFFADMLRLRSNVTGGSALIAFIHNSI